MCQGISLRKGKIVIHTTITSEKELDAFIEELDTNHTIRNAFWGYKDGEWESFRIRQKPGVPVNDKPTVLYFLSLTQYFDDEGLKDRYESSLLQVAETYAEFLLITWIDDEDIRNQVQAFRDELDIQIPIFTGQELVAKATNNEVTYQESMDFELEKGNHSNRMMTVYKAIASVQKM